MVKHCNSSQRFPELNLVQPGAIYLHSLALRKWILKKERSFETQEAKKFPVLQNISIEQKL